MSPEVPDPEQKVFRITPKHPNKWLVSHKITSSDAKRTIANDVVLNAEELEDELDLNFILDHIHIEAVGVRSKGINAVAFSVATTIGSVALRMGKDMDSPEIVYMSGYYFYGVLDQLAQKLNPQIEAGRQGARRFVSEEAKKKQLDKEEREAEKVAASKDKLQTSLAQFAEQGGLSDPQHLEILKRLTFMPNSDNQKKHKIIDLLKTGDIAGAYEILQKVNIREVLDERI
ncbi:MAG: hypothetical protein A2860_03655 [Candidatus Levybacteria bacterium RIFCSPHIGHO2_01_FULL_37_33]|nr:MAG: hypothetical protein A2860_03655 [Candidatus Levybacteria bacterium RIFCSPHIGHO2_01_FULL_37_33]OGH15718.1 MAG: hypothetical protein A3C97_01965 [Candidatus Levybacteria bacterium RIFCSPHIGHO2_02_FULL_37_11]OGH29271.1 MAG: hypothetical protein A3F30_03015 [Candidatus Levybacteria bacterium RIFCSPHIGHO2_12_FULL_37_12]OGH33026.1 MAG: hypothetical protein A2953_03650 [Candidatus Levybacteria bacterium RIFCSPLOWO2_01_FULL_36_54]